MNNVKIDAKQKYEETLTILIGKDLKDRLEKFALEKNRSVGNIIRKILYKVLMEREIE